MYLTFDHYKFALHSDDVKQRYEDCDTDKEKSYTEEETGENNSTFSTNFLFLTACKPSDLNLSSCLN